MAELSAREQLFLELMNRARMDPAGEALRYGLADLNAGLPAGTIDTSPKQVLAPNALLTDAAKSHSQWMLDMDIFSHTGVNGTDPGARMLNAGFVFTGSWGWGENIAWAGSTGTLDANAAVLTEHRGLFLSAGHRENILDAFFREAGVGALTGQYTPGLPDVNTYNALMTTVDFARSGTTIFVTGVTYNDTDNNNFYSIGEGVAGRTFELLSGSTVLSSAVGMAAGGYGIRTTYSGVMELHITGGGLTADIGATFTLGNTNVKIDLTDNSTIESNTSVMLTRATSNVTLLGIENISATGNVLNNVIVGNLGNNVLNGGTGLDTAAFSGSRSSYTVTKSGATYTVTDTNLADGNEGTDTLTNIELLQFSDGTRKLGSVASDFNGDGKSDILWRNNSTGADTLWLGGNNATTQSVATVSTAWKIAGNGDFNGDGKSDILWRNGSTGGDTIWLSGNNATTQSVATVADLNWKVAGIGDFNGDSKDDILWRNTSTGGDTLWLSGNSATTQSVATVADQNWKIAGIGDFSGDGKDDILWRNASTGANTIWKNGSNASTQSVATVTDQNWKVAGIGDFDGDGKSDILWRNSSTGTDTIWKGGNSATTQSVTTVADQNWKVTGIGDYNGDGKDDILWRNSSTGADTIWKGGSSASPQSVATVADQNWQIPEQDSTWLTAAGAYPV